MHWWETDERAQKMLYWIQSTGAVAWIIFALVFLAGFLVGRYT